ncbi:DUF935 domain-containing protein [Beggiatoa leptomitoformis]|uniref:DUF935 family protein n=1 Tax=Beggiatoa leptomitoformis TaxID=288004 RepID=A0A2N9YH97_9GAMM|nr:DUF935 family protein [Beggiatoa leptomitoformis]ALG67884.1 DUF935 family protein [Beggiatoa leptomitoformis]AUI69854.1 DUF935 family protein [Beggiatoa leptomitoformis]
MVTKPLNPLLNELAGNSTDPRFFTGLFHLPNPDPVLRKMGKTQEVYDAIQKDPFVTGQLRAIRAGLLGFEQRLQMPASNRVNKRAYELCQQVLDRKPAQYWQWGDIIWQIAEAVFRGYSAIEIVWEKQGDYLLPAQILPRPNRRFIFNYEGEPRLLTRDSPVMGEELPPYKFLLTRHMPSYTNPYGEAVFSSCFWTYTFKHGGFKYWSKFCERFGTPWTIGKYPAGTDEITQAKLLQGLEQMVEMAVSIIPSDGEVQLLEPTARGESHDNFIKACNKEMGIALTSQTLASDIQGNGSRAAAETHRGREQAGFECDREMVSQTLSELCRWITEINIGTEAEPPTHEFYEEAEARQDWTDVLDKARHYLPISRQFAYDRLQIPAPKDGDELLSADTPISQPAQPITHSEHCQHEHEYQSWAGVTDPVLNPLVDLIDKAKDYEDVQLQTLLKSMDTDPLHENLILETFKSAVDGYVAP